MEVQLQSFNEFKSTFFTFFFFLRNKLKFWILFKKIQRCTFLCNNISHTITTIHQTCLQQYKYIHHLAINTCQSLRCSSRCRGGMLAGHESSYWVMSMLVWWQDGACVSAPLDIFHCVSGSWQDLGLSDQCQEKPPGVWGRKKQGLTTKTGKKDLLFHNDPTL